MVKDHVHIMARTAQISKEKQSIITLRHEGQSMRNISRTFSFLKCSRKNHYDETVSHEDRHRKGRPRVTSTAEDKFIRVTSLRNCSQNKCVSVQVTDTSQHHLFRGDRESGLRGRIAAKKPLPKDTNNKKRLAWAKKHDQWKSVFGLMSPNVRFLVPTAVSL